MKLSPSQVRAGSSGFRGPPAPCPPLFLVCPDHRVYWEARPQGPRRWIGTNIRGDPVSVSVPCPALLQHTENNTQLWDCGIRSSPTPGTCEHDLLWKSSLQVKSSTRSYCIREGPNPMTGALDRSWKCTQSQTQGG